MLAEYREVLDVMSRVAATQKVKPYIVGGIVRDLLLGVSSYDLDFTIEGDAVGAAKQFAKMLGVQITVHEQFLTAKVGPVKINDQRQYIDVVTARSERYGFPGKLPQVAPGTIKDDLLRRDFSINALAIPLTEVADLNAQNAKSKVLDVCGGLRDLADKKIRVLHERSFFDDPTRMYRACRYAGRMGMDFELETEKLLQVASESGCVNTVSHFRRFAEIEKFCSEGEPIRAFEYAFRFGLMHQLGWYAKLHDSEVKAALMAGIASAKPENRYGVTLRILGHFALPAERMVRLQGLQQGKNFVREVLGDIEGVQSGASLSKITDSGLIAAISLGSEGGFKKEAQRRGLI